MGVFLEHVLSFPGFFMHLEGNHLAQKSSLKITGPFSMVAMVKLQKNEGFKLTSQTKKKRRFDWGFGKINKNTWNWSYTRPWKFFQGEE